METAGVTIMNLNEELLKKNREIETLKKSILGILFEHKNGFISDGLMITKIENLTQTK